MQSHVEQAQAKIEAEITSLRARLEKLAAVHAATSGEDWRIISAYLADDLPALRTALLGCSGTRQELGALQGKIATLESTVDLRRRLAIKAAELDQEIREHEARLQQIRTQRAGAFR